MGGGQWGISQLGSTEMDIHERSVHKRGGAGHDGMPKLSGLKNKKDV